MRRIKLLLAVLAMSCASNDDLGGFATDATLDSSDGSSDVGLDSRDDGPSCLAGETNCSGVCIVGTDCTHAVATDPPDAKNVWVNGNAFVRFRVGSAAGVTKVRVSDAFVPFRFEGGADEHLRIEVPPNVAGDADVTLVLASGTVTTKRALTYRTGPTGTSWTKKTMTASRGGFPAMVTTYDNRALVAGGYTKPTVPDCTDTADLFDRASATSTPAANTMSTKRWTATATTLLDGRSVVAGGCYTLGSCPYDSQALDFFDPKTNTFTKAKAKLGMARGFLRSQLLVDGRILYASDETPSFEIFDPYSDTVSSVSGGTFSSPSPVTGWTARLRDGRVLIVPGDGKPNAIFDGTTFVPTGDSLPWVPDALVPIGDGRVFAIGGGTISNESGTLYVTMTDAIAVFEPATSKFKTLATKLATARAASTVVYSRDGLIYVIGGWTGKIKVYASCTSDADVALVTFLSSVETYDPTTDKISAGPSLPEPNLSLRSTILADGSILAGGGTPCGSKAVSYPSVYFLEAPPVK